MISGKFLSNEGSSNNKENEDLNIEKGKILKKSKEIQGKSKGNYSKMAKSLLEPKNQMNSQRKNGIRSNKLKI